MGESLRLEEGLNQAKANAVVALVVDELGQVTEYRFGIGLLLACGQANNDGPRSEFGDDGYP